MNKTASRRMTADDWVALEDPASLRRKLRVAERLVEKAKTPGAKKAAQMSVWMLKEMLKP